MHCFKEGLQQTTWSGPGLTLSTQNGESYHQQELHILSSGQLTCRTTVSLKVSPFETGLLLAEQDQLNQEG